MPTQGTSDEEISLPKGIIFKKVGLANGGLATSLPFRSFVMSRNDRAEGATSAQREGEKRRRKERLVILRRPEIEQQWHSIVMDKILSAAFVLYAKIAANQIQGKQKECQSTSVCITWLPCETEVKHFDLIALL